MGEFLLLFVCQDLLRAGAERLGLAAGADAQGAAVHGQPFGIDDMEAVALEQDLEGGQGVEGEVLMVERVPLQLFEEIAGIHEFEAQVAFVGENDCGGVENLHRIVVMSEGEKLLPMTTSTGPTCLRMLRATVVR